MDQDSLRARLFASSIMRLWIEIAFLRIVGSLAKVRVKKLLL
jgi:hypothetical protein